MEEYKYKKYLKPKKGYLDEKQIDINRYDGIEDHTFDQWFDLKEDISLDDAEEYLYIWLQKVPTPEEAEKERLRQEKQDRKRRLERGKAACRNYCLNHIEQAEHLEKRSQEMIQDLEARIEALGHAEDTVFLTRRMKLRGKIRALEMNLERFADAREYLLAPEELSENE